ncbi:MAG TPA: asparagine synthase (glutamine-hydrolyzing) [Variovorax sp.]|nr:asparagine synthase (glutamine-hydrolyzing) [Variovorax sp.]
MCGLAAVVGLKGEMASLDTVTRMLETIVHRGPDDHGTHLDGAIALGFRRLSILDLSPHGHQPMHSPDGQHTIIFNGEIYNFVELREQLEALGHRFVSTGDTEVLLAAYRQWGDDCVKRLNGMWAFVIHDRARQRVFGSRDRFGMKPLYRWQGDRHMLFASEIKSIRASGLYRGGLNLRACAAFLYNLQLDETNESFHEGIVQLPAGHAFELSTDGRYREWSFWHLEALHAEAPRDPVGAFAELFEDAMRIHMRSDVPVGVNLSGGLDSTSILCATARIRQQAGADSPLLAFCYHDPVFDERRYVDDTLRQTGAQMVPLTMTPQQLWDSLPAVLKVQDEPLHAMSGLIGYHLMHLARSRGVKVVLNGQGADELLAGYGSYFPHRWFELARSGHLIQAWHEISDYSQAHGGSASQRYAKVLKQAALAPLRGALAASRQRRARRMQQEGAIRGNWIRSGLAEHLPQPYAGDAGQADLRPALIGSIRRTPLPLYLRVEDRNAMAHSVEARLPFLDSRLVELSFSLGSQWKTHGRWNKHILREAMRGRIPESVRARVDKMGFSTSSGAWFRGALREPLTAVIREAGRAHPQFFDAGQLERLLQEHLSGKATHTSALFSAAQFHHWLQQHG